MTPLDHFIIDCHHALVHDNNPEVNSARDYLHGRKLLDSTINSNTIGYSYASATIPKEIKEYGSDDDEKCDCSYFIRGRIVVPIYSEFGEAVGLATRKPSTAPGNSWWNMPAPFKKGNYLFMLDKARKAIFAKNKAYIVEGYMDALIPNQAGLDNVVSIMGTATTLRRIGLLARYCNNVCICMDADENKAGQNAQDLAVSLLRRFDFCESISVIMGLPIGVDPDEYVMEYGLNKFLSLEKTLSASEIRKICKEVESRQRFKPKHDNTK